MLMQADGRKGSKASACTHSVASPHFVFLALPSSHGLGLTRIIVVVETPESSPTQRCKANSP